MQRSASLEDYKLLWFWPMRDEIDHIDHSLFPEKTAEKRAEEPVAGDNKEKDEEKTHDPSES